MRWCQDAARGYNVVDGSNGLDGLSVDLMIRARARKISSPPAGRPDYSDRDDALFGITVGSGRLRSTPNPCGRRRRPLPTHGAK